MTEKRKIVMLNNEKEMIIKSMSVVKNKLKLLNGKSQLESQDNTRKLKQNYVVKVKMLLENGDMWLWGK